ncbi:MAG TPA: SDR family oxidoreductase [Candidatus Nocardiopsis merdipullorum]|nr:SDR family oxidoreductase [Candidatus Nocardiopsis merdipullorum]
MAVIRMRVRPGREVGEVVSRWKKPLVLVGARWAWSRVRRRRVRAKGPGEQALDLAAWAGAGALVGVGSAVFGEYRRAHRMTGKVALITGGTRGLGLQLARELGASGARVVICGRDSDHLARAVSGLAERGVEAHGVMCDVTDRDQVHNLVAETMDLFGRIDMVVNNAGVIQIGPSEAFDESHFTHAMDVMFWGPFHVSRAVMDHLRDSRGTIVNITSIGAYLTPPHLLPYGCAKHAQAALSEGLAAETGGTGVRVTTVVPGLMRTGSHVGVTFIGDPEREYAWFALLAGLPLLSVNAQRAARRIVAGAARGKGFVIVTPAARIGMALHGLAPGLTQAGMRVAGRLLPDAPHSVREREGTEARNSRLGRLADAVATLNNRAGERLNQKHAEPR